MELAENVAQMGTAMRTLVELIGGLHELSPDGTVFAASPWALDSHATCVDEPDQVGIGSDLTYFLEVDLIQDVAEVWSQWRDGRVPTAQELTQAAIHYAEHDAYVPLEGPE